MSDNTENASQALALRREARRRRILENSKNRLRLIEGVISSSSISSEKKICQHPEQRRVTETERNELQNVPNDEKSRESESNSKPNDLFKYRETINEVPIFNLKDEEDEEEEEEAEDDYGNIVLDEKDIKDGEEKEQKSYIGVVFEKRLHYVLLACLVNLMFFYDAGFLIYENIFCPFYTIKIIEWLAGRQKKAQAQMKPMMLFLTAGLPQYVQKFIVVFYSVTSVLLSDLCIYIFSFVMGTKLIYTET